MALLTPSGHVIDGEEFRKLKARFTREQHQEIRKIGEQRDGTQPKDHRGSSERDA